MDVCGYMERHGLTDEALDAMAAPYERGDYAAEDGEVRSGSHVGDEGTTSAPAEGGPEARQPTGPSMRRASSPSWDAR